MGIWMKSKIQLNKDYTMKPIKLFFITILLIGFVSTAAAARFDNIDPNDPYDWFDTDNWSDGVVPFVEQGIFNNFATDANSIISGAGSDAGCSQLRLGVGNVLTIENGASYTSDNYVDLGFAENADSFLVVNNATFSSKLLHVAVGKDNSKGYATFTDADYIPYNADGASTYIYVCRNVGSIEGEITFDNSTLSALNHDGTASKLAIILTLFPQDAVATMNILNNSDINTGRHVIVGQSSHGIFNMDGGSLTTGAYLSIGNENDISTYNGWGELVMSGGTITTMTNFNVRTGSDSHYSTVNMTGGTINITGYFAMMRNAVLDISGDSVIQAGTVRMDEIEAPGVDPDCTLSSNAALSCGSLIINGGTLDLNDSAVVVVNGDFQEQAWEYIYAGKITGSGMQRYILVDYDNVADQTTLSMGSDPEMLKKAYLPSPTIGADVRRDVTLSWTPGDGAITHTVYLSLSADIPESPSFSPVYSGTDAEYTFTVPVDGGETYYWRVDEYNGSETTIGDVWSFTAAGIDIDNFDYADTAALQAVWSSNSNASIEQAEYTTQIEFTYDCNSIAPYYAEITRACPITDFTAFDLKAMDVTFLGTGLNSQEPIFVTLSDGIYSVTVVSVEPLTSQEPKWQTWHIDFNEFVQVNGDLDLTNIQTISLGVGNKTNPQLSGTGTVVFDDIVLFEPRCFESSLTGDFNNDCEVDIEDFSIFVEEWLLDNHWPAD